ncbi:hypothetical protein [Blastopirellula marina]|uniref:Uncharacterized protein n=1 Tax=Blastopirellula marina TaxID=124 RepID=A0A2S8FLI8_9BACT|nr:hypothetical protein [Blastopirellula marina]PQO33017.1 hypothetical protein C5Y98_17940 [Blastopirellula marina]PTL43184.1 hypothetical protein C5Y97_17950 [Blastopirellula marina]
MQRFGCYALIATYLVVQLFGQVIHAWSGCEHAHLPGQHWTVEGSSAASVANADDHGHHHAHASHYHAEPTAGPGWSPGHQHRLAIDGCLLCQHLALGQIAPATTDVAIESTVVEPILTRTVRLATEKWLGPNSPRAPPIA